MRFVRSSACAVFLPLRSWPARALGSPSPPPFTNQRCFSPTRRCNYLTHTSNLLYSGQLRRQAAAVLPPAAQSRACGIQCAAGKLRLPAKQVGSRRGSHEQPSCDVSLRAGHGGHLCIHISLICVPLPCIPSSQVATGQQTPHGWLRPSRTPHQPRCCFTCTTCSSCTAVVGSPRR